VTVYISSFSRPWPAAAGAVAKAITPASAARTTNLDHIPSSLLDWQWRRSVDGSRDAKRGPGNEFRVATPGSPRRIPASTYPFGAGIQPRAPARG
jgi:hypothetical protein